MAKSKIRDTRDLFRGLAEGFRVASKSPTIYGYEPHDKQKDFHSSDAQGRLFIGGNRSGKTVGGATDIIWTCLDEHPHRLIPWDPPIRARAIAVDFLNGVEKIIKPEIARWVPKSKLRDGSWEAAYDKELRTLHFDNGSFIEFMSYDQDLDKFAGTSRHIIWFDEEPPKDIFTENKLRLLDTGGHWLMTMTPVEGMTWVYDDIYTKALVDPTIHVTEVDTTQNPHLNPGQIELVMSGLTDDEIEARVHGKFVQIGGLIYKYFSPENIIDPMIPPKSWTHLAGLDHGFTNPTAWLWAAVDEEGRHIIYDEHYEAGQVVSYHALRVHQKNRNHLITPEYYVGDPSIENVDPITGTSVKIEYVENGIPILTPKGLNDVLGGINRVSTLIGGGKQQLPRKLYITRNCINTLWEIQRYRWAIWAQKRHNFEKNKKEEPHKKDDHAMDALKYIVASRPFYEDGTIAEEPDGMGYREAVNPYSDRVDPAFAGRKPSQFDDVLGEEW